MHEGCASISVANPASITASITESASISASIRKENAKQRWGRESYNAFQRAYLPVWRAVKAGRACWIPRRMGPQKEAL